MENVFAVLAELVEEELTELTTEAIDIGVLNARRRKQ